MRPALIDMIDDYGDLESSLEETNSVVGQLNAELGTEIERAKAAEQVNASSIQTLSDDLAAIPVFEYGAQNSIEILADDSETASVEFASEKESAPYVLISIQCGETENEADCYGIITDVNTTGFTVRLINKDELNTVEITLFWLAIGE